jgi:transcriptional regulator with XRE-family HTH domain
MPLPSHAKVGTAVATRRVHLGLRQRDLAAAAGVSETTIRNIEAGRIGGRPTKWPLVEQALRWAPGSFEALVEGRQPAEIDVRDEPADEEDWTIRLPTRIREELTGRELFDSAVVDVPDGLRLIVLAVETEAPHDRAVRRRRIQRWEDVQRRLHALPEN